MSSCNHIFHQYLLISLCIFHTFHACVGVPINGNWNSWLAWSECSVSCGSGSRTRTRLCNYPKPQNGGRSCYGNGEETISCEQKSCPNDWHIRLFGDEANSRQQLKVFLDGQWFKVCADEWSSFKTRLVCRHILSALDDSSETSAEGSSVTDDRRDVLLYIDCPSISDSFSDCTHRVVEAACCTSGNLTLTCLHTDVNTIDVNTTFLLKFSEGDYPLNFYHERIFNAPSGKRLHLNITVIDTELGEDFFTIGTGNITNTHHLISYSGGPAVNVLNLLHDGNTLWISFVTGYSTLHRGIEVYVKMFKKYKTCDRNYNSRNYANQVCHNGTCTSSETQGRPADCYNTEPGSCAEGYKQLCGNSVCVLSEPHRHVANCYNPDRSFVDKSTVVAYIGDDGQVRLSDDHRGYNSGLLEVKMGNNWLRVCADTWNQNETKVACNQLGFRDGSAHFSDSDGSLCIKSISCNGEEDYIKECGAYVTTTPSCVNNSVVSLTCGDEGEGSVLLRHGADPFAGLLQVFFKGNWKYLCGNGLTKTVADVACENMEGEAAFITLNVFHTSINESTFLHGNFTCSDGDTSFANCSFSQSATPCNGLDFVGVICEGSTLSNLSHSEIRLSSKQTLEGYVEIHFNDTWYSVCDKGWNRGAGDVVCRQLGHGLATSVSGVSDRENSGPIILSGLQCTGDESNLFDCQYESIGNAGNKCNRSNDAWVKCLPLDETTPFDFTIVLALGLFSLTIVAMACMMWYRQVLTTRRLLKRPLPPIPPMSTFHDDDDSEGIYNEIEEIEDVEDPYYMTPIGSKEDVNESSGVSGDVVIEIHSIFPNGKENLQQKEDRLVVDDMLIDDVDDNKNEHEPDVDDDMSVKTSTELSSELQFSQSTIIVTDERRDETSNTIINGETAKQTVTGKENQSKKKKCLEDAGSPLKCPLFMNDEIKGGQFEDDEAEEKTPGPGKTGESQTDDTGQKLCSSSVFFDRDRGTVENDYAAGTDNNNAESEKFTNDNKICFPKFEDEIKNRRPDEEEAQPQISGGPSPRRSSEINETDENLYSSSVFLDAGTDIFVSGGSTK